jgi:RecA-family ATPase
MATDRRTGRVMSSGDIDLAWLDDEDSGSLTPRRSGGASGLPSGRLAEPLDPIDPATFDGKPIPERQWLAQDWVPMRRVTGLYGLGGEGKTMLAQMLATACAIGGRWLGLPTRRCKSLLLFCEDDAEEMQRRQEAINHHYECDFADLGAIRWLPRLGHDNVLMTFEAGRGRLTPLFDDLCRGAADHGAELIVVDTLADVFCGSENDRAQARAFVQMALGALARETGAAVIVLAHPSLTGANSGIGSSGSTGWLGTFRSHLFLTTPKPEEGEPPERDIRELTRVKANFARRGETIELEWKDNVFVPTHAPSGILGSIERRNCEAVFLDLLDKTTEEGQPVSSNTRAGNFAPRLFAARPERQRFKKADFEHAMQALFAAGQIRPEPYGRKGDERYRIARCAR